MGNNRHPLLICLLGCAFLAILGVSVAERIMRPSLTHQTMPATAEAGNQSMSGMPQREMDNIGRLMREAAQHPNDLNILLRLTENLLAIGQWQAAENFGQKALELNPPKKENDKILYLLSLAHHNKGEHAQAADILEKLLSGSENPSARYSLGILYAYYLNRPQEGLEQLKKGLETPNLSPALERAIREELGKLDSAGATKTSPDNRQNANMQEEADRPEN